MKVMPRSRSRTRRKRRITPSLKTTAALLAGGAGASYLLDTKVNSDLCLRHSFDKPCVFDSFQEGDKYEVLALGGHSMIRIFYTRNGTEETCTIGVGVNSKEHPDRHAKIYTPDKVTHLACHDPIKFRLFRGRLILSSNLTQDQIDALKKFQKDQWVKSDFGLRMFKLKNSTYSILNPCLGDVCMKGKDVKLNCHNFVIWFLSFDKDPMAELVYKSLLERGTAGRLKFVMGG